MLRAEKNGQKGRKAADDAQAILHLPALSGFSMLLIMNHHFLGKAVEQSSKEIESLGIPPIVQSPSWALGEQIKKLEKLHFLANPLPGDIHRRPK